MANWIKFYKTSILQSTIRTFSFENQHETPHLIIYGHLEKIKSATTNQQLGRSVTSYMSHMHQVNTVSSTNEINAFEVKPPEVYIVAMTI